MNLCTDISDAEPRTGQRNALCVVTPEQEIFIRADNKEIINGSVGDPGEVTAGGLGRLGGGGVSLDFCVCLCRQVERAARRLSEDQQAESKEET